jgi:hypothetical protein
MWPFSTTKEETYEEKYEKQHHKDDHDRLWKEIRECQERIVSLETLCRKNGIYLSCKTCKFEGDCPIGGKFPDDMMYSHVTYGCVLPAACSANRWRPKEVKG